MKVEAVIDDVVIEPRKIQPIIVNFQNGQLKDTEAKKMKSSLFYDKKRKRSLLAMSNGQIVYRGYRPEASKELTYTMLAVHNRRTGKVRLIQAERWQVAPVLDKEPERTGELEGNRVMMLNREFGSKKIKRKTEQMEKMKVNVDNVAEQLEQTVSNVEIDKEDLDIVIESSEDIPPCNRKASTVEDVYNIHDIIPNDLLEILKTKVDEILQLERDSTFYVTTLAAIKDTPQRERKIAILEYIYSIITWLNTPIKTAKKSFSTICPVSPEVSQHIVDTYSMNSASGRLRPTSMRDKGVLHSIILCLMISKFKVNLELLSSSLNSKMGMKKLAELARVLGAVVNKDDKRMATLKVPLPAAPSLIKKKRKP